MATDVITTIGATSSPVTPDYSTLQAWEDDLPADLVAADERHIGECLDQGEFTGASPVVTISGQTTDSTRYIILRPASGAGFRDKAGVRSTALDYNASNGVAIRSTSGNYQGAFRAVAAFTQVQGLQIKGVSHGVQTNAAANVLYDSCIIQGAGKSGVFNDGASTPPGVTFVNCLIRSASGHNGAFHFGAHDYYGCTLIGAGTATAFANRYGTVTAAIKNCAAFGYSTFSGGWSATNASHNATDLATGLGSSNQTSLTFADQFESTTNDFRVKAGADLIAAGDYDGTNTPDDISGGTRHPSTPTIGAWEAVWENVTTIGATSSPVTPDYSTLQAWEDDCPANLTADIYKWVGECLDQGEFTASGAILTIAGQTTDATRNIILRCASGASFADHASVRSNALFYNASNGVAIRCTGAGYIQPFIQVSANYTRIECLQITGPSAGSSWAMRVSSTNTVIDSCIFNIQGAEGIRLNVTTVNNCLFHGSGGIALRCANGSGDRVNGCTIVNGGTALLAANYTGVIVKNTALFGNSSAFGGNTSKYTGSDFNGTDKASLPGGGSNNLTSLTFADQFESTTNDFRAVSTGDLQAGTPDATNTPDDITGLSRDATTPWIGCWEVAGGVAPIMAVLLSGRIRKDRQARRIRR